MNVLSISLQMCEKARGEVEEMDYPRITRIENIGAFRYSKSKVCHWTMLLFIDSFLRLRSCLLMFGS